jgi:deoxyribonuclease-4
MGEKMLFGAHMSIAGGFEQAIFRGAAAKCDVVQIFTKNNNRWQAKKIQPAEIENFKKAQKETGVRCIAAHTAYLINCASPDNMLYSKSVEALIVEAQRAEQLEIPMLVLHPGAHIGSGLKQGAARIVQAIRTVLKRTKGYNVRIILETTSGQGSSIGHSFEELALILRNIKDRKRIGICFDTCHAFAAGYDLRDKKTYRQIFTEFDTIIGIEYLKMFHINDSKKGLGSHIDRHAHIGKGFIGKAGFQNLVTDRRFSAIPMILETPKGNDLKEDKQNLKILRELAQ